MALNCVANARIVREGPFKSVFIQPAAGDAGTALGAAALAHRNLNQNPLPKEPLRHVFWGPSFAPNDIREVVGGLACASDYTGNEPALWREAAKRLAEGKVLAWFRGRMEFGPRSLGARSILADPRRADMRDKINALVKMREGFRPFAPAVLWEDTGKYFDLSHPSPFMLETCPVLAKNLPAITHVDGSARVQTVSSGENPDLAALLTEFKSLTNCSVLLNTSFNIRGEPIVCSPTDASAANPTELSAGIRGNFSCWVKNSRMVKIILT